MRLQPVQSVPLFAEPEELATKKRHASLFPTKHSSWLALNNYPIPDDFKARTHKQWLTRDKTGVLRMRDVTKDDKERMIKAFKTLSADSIRRRFCCEKESLTIKELESMINCDFHHDYTVIVVAACPCEKNHINFTKHAEGEGCREDVIVGIGQYIGLVHNEFEAEMAFLVTDQYQGQRIARRMLEHLLLQARENGFVTMRVDTQYDNLKMQHLITHNCDDTIIRRDGQEISISIPVPGNETDLKTCPSAQQMSSFLDVNENFTTRSSRRRSSVAISNTNTKYPKAQSEAAGTANLESGFTESDSNVILPKRPSKISFYDLADMCVDNLSSVGEELLSKGERDPQHSHANTDSQHPHSGHSPGQSPRNRSSAQVNRESSPNLLDPMSACSMHHVSPQTSHVSQSTAQPMSPHLASGSPRNTSTYSNTNTSPNCSTKDLQTSPHTRSRSPDRRSVKSKENTRSTSRSASPGHKHSPLGMRRERSYGNEPSNRGKSGPVTIGDASALPIHRAPAAETSMTRKSSSVWGSDEEDDSMFGY